MREVDTIIVGGGPAGSSCARELLREGRQCLVLERKAMPRLKLCAGWVTPKVLADLDIDPASYPHGIVKLEAIKAFFGRRLARTARCVQYSIRRVEARFEQSPSDQNCFTEKLTIGDGAVFSINLSQNRGLCGIPFGGVKNNATDGRRVA